MKPTRAARSLWMLASVFASLLLVAGAWPLLGQIAKNSQQLTTEAWNAFNKADFNGAIAKAEECIDKFKDDADDKQQDLRRKNTPEPPTDEFSPTERDTILKRGPLNDVATSFFIIGQSEEELYRRGKGKDPQHNERAKKAYKETCRYTYARTWDPGGGGTKGFFWSPSKKACRLAEKL